MNSRTKLLLALVSLGLTATVAAQTYTVTDLGVLPGDSSSLGYYVNASGQVTGCSDNTTQQTDLCQGFAPSDAYVWTSSTGMQSLGGLSGYDASVGFVINTAGTIVGFLVNTQSGRTHGFVWSQSSAIVDLGTLQGGDAYSIADAINTQGIIVGESLVSNGDVHAVAWTVSGGSYHIKDLGILPGAPYTYPYVINDKLQVAGVAYFDPSGMKYHGFLATQSGGFKDLGTLPGGGNSFADWINNKGVIVGFATSASFPNGVAVVWDTSRKIHAIGTLNGGTSSYAGGINDLAQVVGESTVAGNASHAFIWTVNQGMKDLNDLIPSNSGWVLNHASTIGNDGRIVGYGTIQGATHGFLLTP